MSDQQTVTISVEDARYIVRAWSSGSTGVLARAVADRIKAALPPPERCGAMHPRLLDVRCNQLGAHDEHYCVTNCVTNESWFMCTYQWREAP